MQSISQCVRFCALLVIAGLTACDSGPDPEAMPAMVVQVVQAERRDVPLIFEMVGATLGNQDVPIRARVEGFLESLNFQEGRFVNKGDLLYTIDPQPFQAKLVEAQSRLAAEQTQLAKAEADLARIRPLAEINAVSQQDLDGAIAQEAASRAGVRAAQAAVDLANIELGYTKIYAPIDGLIGLTKAKPGEFVGRDPNPVVLNTLSDIDPIRVRFSISEREYLTFVRDESIYDDAASRNEQFEADTRKPLELILADGSLYEEVGYLDGAAQSIDPSTGTLTLEATFPNPKNYLLPGQFARVRALYQELENVVVIPRQALIELQGRFQVYVVTGEGVVDVREVKIGPQKDNDIVIESGLSGGESIIVEGVQKVRKGSPVQAQPFQPKANQPAMQET